MAARPRVPTVGAMRQRTLLAALAVCLVAVFAVPSAHAAAATGCGDLTAAQARITGERFMERMLGSARAREAMDRTMATMMGAEGVRQAHEMMGRSAQGCPAGNVPAGMSRMMGAMGAMAGMMGGGSPYYDGMMDRGGRGMMGGPRFDDDDSDTAETIVVVLMTLLVAAVLVAVAVLLTRRSGGTPTAPGPPSAPSAGA